MSHEKRDLRWLSLAALVASSVACSGNVELTGPRDAPDADSEAPEASADPGNTPPAVGDVPEDTVGASATPTTYVAISGGGFRSHTAQAGWTMGMLDAMDSNSDQSEWLAELFEPVAAFSSNSGGTWYLTMMAYSSAFADALVKEDAVTDYISPSGYLGQLKAQYGKVAKACSLPSLICEKLGVLSPLLTVAGKDLDWVSVVKTLVFYPLSMSTSLESVAIDRSAENLPSWADRKGLLFATSMLTQVAVLNKKKESAWDVFEDKQFYSATSTQTPAFTEYTVTPAIIAHTPGSTEPDFFPGGDMTVAYGEDASPTHPKTSKQIELSASQADGTVLVMSAAAASSAAAAGLGSTTAVGELDIPIPLVHDDFIAYEGRNMAPAFTMDPPKLTTIENEVAVDDLAKGKYVRLADGGYTDNIGVATMLKHLADNEKLDGFNIVAFDNSGDAPVAYENVEGIPDSVARLFGISSTGEPSTGHDEMCLGDGHCLEVPLGQVFETPALSTKATWKYSHDGVNLYYFKYQHVSLVDNAAYGLSGGSTGTLHMFVSQALNAPDVPTNADTFTNYETLLNAVYQGVTAGGGWEHLDAALNGS